MSRPYHMSRAMLTAFHPSRHHTSLLAQRRRETRETIRRFVDRFWAPVTRGNGCGATLPPCRIRENLESFCMPNGVFTAQVNGAIGGAALVEDFFASVLLGFDIVQCHVEAPSDFGPANLSAAADPCHHRGQLVLVHARPLLGWVPAPDAAPLRVPFSMHVEGGIAGARPMVSHLVLRSPALQAIAASPDCPPAVRDALLAPQAPQALADLQRRLAARAAAAAAAASSHSAAAVIV